MKKILLIVVICLSCYSIYEVTADENIFYLSMGDFLSRGVNNHNHVDKGYFDEITAYLGDNNKLDGSDNSFSDKDMRITDLLRMIEYNDEKVIEGQTLSINNLLNKADVITVSVGLNELYYKLFANTDNIYYYASEMLEDMGRLMEEISRYNHKKVFVMGYYNVTDDNQDVFVYLNHKLRMMARDYGFEFVDLDGILKDKKRYFNGDNNYYPNNLGYARISEVMIDYIKNY